MWVFFLVSSHISLFFFIKAEESEMCYCGSTRTVLKVVFGDCLLNVVLGFVMGNWLFHHCMQGSTYKKGSAASLQYLVRPLHATVSIQVVNGSYI